MRYKVIYDKGTRLRVRSGKNAFSKNEGYGLASILLQKDYIKDVLTSHKNGGILVYYQNPENKKDVLNILNNISIDDLFECKPSSSQELKDLRDNFLWKLSGKILKRFCIQLFFPMKLKIFLTLVQSVRFIFNALNSLFSLMVDVNLLDGVAISASICKKDFKAPSSMMFLISISNLLEEYTFQRSKSSFKESLSLNINNVWLIDYDDNVISCSVDDICEGDRIKVYMGNIIPFDGRVVSGEAMVNESAMTGEPLAVYKKYGKTVHAGTVIEQGNLIIEVYCVNEDTRLNKIVSLIENSESLKADVESKAERLSNSVVPYSFLITFLTYFITCSSTKALAVLMVDFSCAIKLTTPLSIISAMREALDHRMMVKGGKFLEKISMADTIVFDKTGTLTNASPKVVDIISCGEYSEDEILKISACIEEHFSHSIAHAIVREAEIRDLHHEEEHSEVEYILAHGIATQYHNKHTVIGSRHFIFDDEKVIIDSNLEYLIDKAMQYSVIYLAMDGKLEGMICIDDPLRLEAKNIIEKLKNMGIEKVIMLTGDSENSARNTAQLLDIQDYRSQVLPEEKFEIINNLKNDGHIVIMVGDGINDSPALAAADVSISMMHSSDIAREVSDISLLSDNLNDLVTLRKLSSLMLDKINSNYRKIVMINGGLILLGISGVINPSTSSLIHNLSTMFLTVLSTRSVLEC